MSAPTQLTVVQCPNKELALTNRAVVHSSVVEDLHKYILVKPRDGRGEEFAMAVVGSDDVKPDQIGVTKAHRMWAMLTLGENLPIRPFPKKPDLIAHTTLRIAPWTKASKDVRLDSDEMERQFKSAFNNGIFSQNQMLPFEFKSSAGSVTLRVEVVDIQALDVTKMFKGTDDSTKRPTTTAVLVSESLLVFDAAPESGVRLSGKARQRGQQKSLFAADWSFSSMGVGGLDDQFDIMFRRAFTSRVIPAEIIEDLEITHVKGMLLYGPPGCGKTLIATKIGQMLQGHEPKIVRGPEVLSKYVGQAEENIRELFAPAFEEYQLRGEDSQLHVIIFDEIDAICKRRGTVQSGTGVHDSIVNQLLSMIDGPQKLNNILVIGMTNRPDMIDEALTRPGRLELKLEIGLPNLHGRKQIFTIHTKRAREKKYVALDVDLDELAEISKNYTGAEIASVCEAAFSRATHRCIQLGEGVKVDVDKLAKLQITREDYLAALDEIRPSFGVSDSEFETYLRNGIIEWGDPVRRVLDKGKVFVEQVKNSRLTPLVTVLLTGPPSSGKTALAARIAMDSGFSYIKMISPDDMVGYSDSAKVEKMKQAFDDALRTDASMVILDDIERLLNYVPMGNIFSNAVLQALLVLLKRVPPEGKRLIVIGTTSNKRVLDSMGITDAFMRALHVDTLSDGLEVLKVVEELQPFSTEDMKIVKSALSHGSKLHVPGFEGEVHIHIGIKKLYLLTEMARQEKHGAAERFLEELYEESKYGRSSEMLT